MTPSAVHPDTLTLAAISLLAFAIGAGGGTAYFLTLRTGVRMLTEGRLIAPIALHIVRLAALAAIFFAVARAGGAVPLLATAAGVLAGRAAVLRRERRRD